MPTRPNYERVKELKRECTKNGIRYIQGISSISKLEEILADPYPHRLATFARRTGIDPFDFRGKGIEPKPNAWIRWKAKGRYRRQGMAGYGRFVSWDGPDHAIVRYDIYTGAGYKSRKVRIERFQITDYREDK